MPLQKDPKTGKWVVVGNGGDATAYTPEQPPKPKPKPKKQKSWWEKLTNDLSYEAKRVTSNPVGAAMTYGRNVAVSAAQSLPGPGGAISTLAKGDLGNHIRFEQKQFSNPTTAYARTANIILGIGQGNSPTQVHGRLGSTQAAANIARNLLDIGEGSYLDKGGEVIDSFVDDVYSTGGHKPPSQMNETEKMGDDARASLVLNVGTGAVAGAAVPLLSKAPVIGGLVSRVAAGLNPANAQTTFGAATRIMAGLGLEEVASTYLDDNTGGSFFGLFGMDPVKPGMTRTEASSAAFFPNLAGSALMVGGMGGLGKLVQSAPNVRRAQRSAATRNEIEIERAEQRAAGLVQEDDTGRTAFTEEALQAKNSGAEAPAAEPAPAPTFEDAEAQFMQDTGMDRPTVKETAPAADANPNDDPWGIEYDPSVPESDALGQALNQLDDQQLLEVSQKDSGIPEAVDQLATTPGDGFDPDARLDLTAAPTESLVPTDVSWTDQLGAVPTDRLRSMALPKNSQALHDAIQMATGKEWDEFTRTDILNGLRKLESEGAAVLPNRLMGEPMMDVDDIAVDPERFPPSADADTLAGVEKWDPQKEGVIQVAQDEDGLAYVVDGHRRLEKARELGVPTVRVDFVDGVRKDVPEEEIKGLGLLTPEQRKAVKAQILSKAAQKGEVRPFASPLPDVPKTSDLPMEKIVDDIEGGQITPEVMQLIDDEVRLADEFARMDEAIDVAVTKAEREAIDYDEMTFDEKKEHGVLDGWEEPEKPKLSERFADMMAKQAKADAEFFRTVEEMNAETRRFVDEQVGGEKIADKLRKNLRQIAQSDARALRETSQVLEEFTGGTLSIPSTASKKITARNQRRVQGKAQQLRKWLNHGMPPEKHLIRSDQQAETMVNAKGRLLDVEKIPGVDLDQALEDYAMGMKTPATDAVAKAYREFYVEGARPKRLAEAVDNQIAGVEAEINQIKSDAAKEGC